MGAPGGAGYALAYLDHRRCTPCRPDPSPGDPAASELGALREMVESQVQRIDELTGALAARDARIVELEKLLEESRRSGKRQAAPFSKGEPTDEPRRPGRKRGRGHGRHGHRMAPASIDRELDAPLPDCCPRCGGDVFHERDAEQFQTDLPGLPAPVVTRFKVGVGRCRSCGKRVQGRHAEQVSDALGAAGSQIGPVAKGWVAWLHYGLGLSFGKCASLLGRLGIEVTAGAICSASQSMGTALVPVKNTIVERVNASPTVTMDETGWRVEGFSSWLWVAATEDATAYNVAAGRGFDQACDLVRDYYDGVIIRDGWGPYRSYQAATHQSCVAHLLRRASEMVADLPDWARGTPRQVKDLLTIRRLTRRVQVVSRRSVRVHTWVSERGKSYRPIPSDLGSASQMSLRTGYSVEGWLGTPAKAWPALVTATVPRAMITREP